MPGDMGGSVKRERFFAERVALFFAVGGVVMGGGEGSAGRVGWNGGEIGGEPKSWRGGKSFAGVCDACESSGSWDQSECAVKRRTLCSSAIGENS